jgi:hypothetical protein
MAKVFIKLRSMLPASGSTNDSAKALRFKGWIFYPVCRIGAAPYEISGSAS